MTSRTRTPAPAGHIHRPHRLRCFHCSGIGEVPVHYPDSRGVYVCNWQRCPRCNGTGQWTEPKERTA